MLVRTIRLTRITLYRLKPRKLKARVRQDLLKVKAGLAQEKQETKEMLRTYNSFTRGKATKEEMAEANKQFVDLLKGLGLGVFAVLPFSPITIPLMVKLGKKYNIDLLPSAFNQKEK